MNDIEPAIEIDRHSLAASLTNQPTNQSIDRSYLSIHLLLGSINTMWRVLFHAVKTTTKSTSVPSPSSLRRPLYRLAIVRPHVVAVVFSHRHLNTTVRISNSTTHADHTPHTISTLSRATYTTSTRSTAARDRHNVEFSRQCQDRSVGIAAILDLKSSIEHAGVALDATSYRILLSRLLENRAVALDCIRKVHCEALRDGVSLPHSLLDVLLSRYGIEPPNPSIDSASNDTLASSESSSTTTGGSWYHTKLLECLERDDVLAACTLKSRYRMSLSHSEAEQLYRRSVAFDPLIGRALVRSMPGERVLAAVFDGFVQSGEIALARQLEHHLLASPSIANDVWQRLFMHYIKAENVTRALELKDIALEANVAPIAALNRLVQLLVAKKMLLEAATLVAAMQERRCFVFDDTIASLLELYEQRPPTRELTVLRERIAETLERLDQRTVSPRVRRQATQARQQSLLQSASQMLQSTTETLEIEQLHSLLKKLLRENFEAEAMQLVQRHSLTDRATWSILIAHALSLGDMPRATDMLRRMQLEHGIVPDLAIYLHFCQYHMRHGDLASVYRVMVDMKTDGIRIDDAVVLQLTGYCKHIGRLDLAVALKTHLGQVGVHSSQLADERLLSQLLENQDVATALQVLADMQRNGSEPTLPTLAHLLLELRHQRIQCDAEAAIEQQVLSAPEGHAALFNRLLAYHIQRQHLQLALRLKYRMGELFNVPTDQINYEMLIDHFTRRGMLEQAETLRQEMCDKAMTPSAESYMRQFHHAASLGAIDEALQEFDAMREAGHVPDVQSYTRAIDLVLQADRFDIAQQLLGEMEANQVPPTDATYLLFLAAFIRRGELESAVQMIDELASKPVYAIELEKRPLITPHYAVVLDALLREGRHESAAKLHSRIEQSRSANAVQLHPTTYQALLDRHLERERLEHALATLESMEVAGEAPEPALLQRTLALSIIQGDLATTMRVKDLLRAHGVVPAERVYKQLVRRLVAQPHCEEAVEYATKLLHEWCEPSELVVVDSWSIAQLVAFLIEGRRTNLALGLYKRLTSNPACRPIDRDGYVQVIEALLQNHAVHEASQLLREMQRALGVAAPAAVYHRVLDYYAYAGDMANALATQKTMQQHEIALTASNYSALALLLLSAGRIDAALSLKNEARAQQLPFAMPLYHRLLDELLRHNQGDAAVALVDEMTSTLEGYVPSGSVYAKLLEHFVLHRRLDQALGVRDRMRHAGIVPHHHTFRSLLTYLNKHQLYLELAHDLEQELARSKQLV